MNKKPTKINLTSDDSLFEKSLNLQKYIEDLRSQAINMTDKFSFTWAGKSNAIKSVLVPSKLTLNPEPEQSIKWDESENLFIEGDNLEVLKLLQKAYFEKVKMIYIDPPYNTGHDFVYNDDFSAPLDNYLKQTGQKTEAGESTTTNKETNGRYHSDWLSMMYPRLKLAWNLLREDGVIFVSIDDNEVHHLRMIMDEVFGEENYLNTFCWVNNLKGRQISGSGSAKTYEYIFAYAKDVSQIGIFEESIDKLKSLMPTSYKGFNYETESDDDGEFVVKNELYNTNSAFNEKTRPNLVFNIHYNFKNNQVKFSDPNDSIEFDGYVKISPKKNNDGIHKYHAWRWSKPKIEKELSDLKFVKDGESVKVFTKIRAFLNTALKDIITDITTSNGATDIKDLFNGAKYFDYPKPVDLIRLFVSQTSKDDLILDFFAGSATTAHAVLKQNVDDGGERKFIVVQLPEKLDPLSEGFKAGYKTITDIAKERIRRVIKGYGENPQPIDTGFKVFTLAESNYPENNFVLDADKSQEENQKAFIDYLNKAKQSQLFDKENDISIVYENIVKEGFPLNSEVETITIGKNKVYKISDGEQQLLICLENKLVPETVKELADKSHKDKLFICLESSLDDTTAANLSLNLDLKTI